MSLRIGLSRDNFNSELELIKFSQTRQSLEFQTMIFLKTNPNNSKSSSNVPAGLVVMHNLPPFFKTLCTS